MALRNTMTYGAVLRDDRAKCGRSVPSRGRVLVWLDTAIVRNVAPAKVWRRFGSTMARTRSIQAAQAPQNLDGEAGDPKRSTILCWLTARCRRRSAGSRQRLPIASYLRSVAPT